MKAASPQVVRGVQRPPNKIDYNQHSSLLPTGCWDSIAEDNTCVGHNIHGKVKLVVTRRSSLLTRRCYTGCWGRRDINCLICELYDQQVKYAHGSSQNIYVTGVTNWFLIRFEIHGTGGNILGTAHLARTYDWGVHRLFTIVILLNGHRIKLFSKCISLYCRLVWLPDLIIYFSVSWMAVNAEIQLVRVQRVSAESPVTNRTSMPHPMSHGPSQKRA